MLKRGHLQTVAFGTEVLKKVRGMTPARFDLMYLLRRVALRKTSQPPGTIRVYARRPRYNRRDQEQHEETQISLREKLGLHRSTVSEMILELELYGWIKRRVCETDRRTFVVELTEKGLAKIARAMRLVFRTRVARKAYDRLFGPKEPEPPIVEWVRGQRGGDHASAIAATDAFFEEQKKPGYDPFAGQKPAAVAVHEVYSTLKKIARWFGDRSDVWFHLGRGLPKDL